MSNTFEKLEKASNEVTQEEPNTSVQNNKSIAGEVDLDQLSDSPIGDKTKYVRESLDGQIVTIKSAQLFNADTNEKPIISLSGNSEYYSANFILTYDKKNKDDVYHREYLSGLKQFVQKDGSLSEHQFWYEGAENQVAKLWEAVAKAKNIEPKDLTPRQFMGYLNSGIKAKIVLEKGKFKGNSWEKNLVQEIVVRA